jgi:nitrogen regulatory protein PII
MSKYKHEVIICIVNSGFSDEVMDAAREFGARGGTVIRARGTANAEAEKLFNIAIQPEKEIVMILVESKLKNDILHALYRAVGLNTPGQGIAFTMPVESVVGLTDFTNAQDVKPADAANDNSEENGNQSSDN